MRTIAGQQGAWSYVLDETAKILVADDDPLLREFASVHLSSPTTVIETVADGAAALARLTADHFDMALLDIEMPSLDGFALLEKIRAEPTLRHLPVIMLTAREDIASIDRSFKLGANSFITKPVNWRLLSYHVRYVLRASNVERELRKARRQAEEKKAAYDRTLLAFEVDCRGVLRSILQHASASLAVGTSPEAKLLSTDMKRIEELATAALERWSNPSGKLLEPEKAEEPPDASGGAIRALGR
jgi:two-component system, sensor histidine kinase and response regulator